MNVTIHTHLKDNLFVAEISERRKVENIEEYQVLKLTHMEKHKTLAEIDIYLRPKQLEELHDVIDYELHEQTREDLEAEIEDLKDYITDLESRLEETAQLASSRDREIREREHRKEVL